MSTYLKYPSKAPFDTVAFGADYLALTGEAIQEKPLENEQLTHYLVGSSRITNEQFNILKASYPLISKTNTWPIGWVTKE